MDDQTIQFNSYSLPSLVYFTLDLVTPQGRETSYKMTTRLPIFALTQVAELLNKVCLSFNLLVMCDS